MNILSSTTRRGIQIQIQVQTQIQITRRARLSPYPNLQSLDLGPGPALYPFSTSTRTHTHTRNFLSSTRQLHTPHLLNKTRRSGVGLELNLQLKCQSRSYASRPTSIPDWIEKQCRVRDALIWELWQWQRQRQRGSRREEMESEFERLTNSNNLWDSHGKFIDCAAMEYFEMYRFDVSGAEGREGHAFTGRVVNGSNDLRPGLGLGDSVKMVQAGDDGHSGGGEKSASTANDQGAKPSQQQGKNGQKPASDGSAGSEPTETLDDNSPMPLEQPMSSCGTPSESESSHDGQIPSHRIKQKAVSDSKDEGLESLKASDIRAPYAKLDDEFERRQARRDLEDELDAYVDPATKVDGHEVGSRESSPESCADGSTRQTYRLLAYDPATMDMKTAETTSSTPPAKIMNLEEATLGLNAPAIFLPYVDDMRRDGYEIVSGGGDVLLFRKVGEAAKMPDSEQSTGSDGKSKGGQETEYTGGRNRSGGYNEAEPHHAGTRHGRHTFLTIFTLASAFIISGCYFNGMRWEVEDMCVPSFNAESERRRTS